MTVSAEFAQNLKSAGLVWKPALHDFFSVPDTALDERVFVLTDMMAGTEILQGYRAITFNGATEWALDYVLMMEVLWMPTETQVRDLLQAQLGESGSFTLASDDNAYRCEIRIAEEPLAFSASSASDAYAQALLFMLKRDS